MEVFLLPSTAAENLERGFPNSGRKYRLSLLQADHSHHPQPLVSACLILALDALQKGEGERERPRPIELERGICRTLRGEVRGHCLILIKRARLIVSGNPVCHGRYARASLWHRLTYGLACCLPIQGPSTCSPQLDKFPEPCLPKEWGLLLLFSHPSSPPTCFLLILHSAGAIERSCIIQGGLARERERRGLVRRERGR